MPASALTAQQIVAVLSSMDANGAEKLHWQTSITDFRRLLELDPSLSNPKQLARELEYQGDSDDSTGMNAWLHGALMKRLNHGSDKSDLCLNARKPQRNREPQRMSGLN
jgi:hypothetical protein